MRALFSASISAGAVATLVLLFVGRRSVVQRLGGPTSFSALACLALGANAAMVFLPADGPRSQALVVVSGCFFLLAVFAASSSGIPGGSDQRQRNAWWTLGALLVWCFFTDALVGGGIYGGNRWFTYAAAAAVWAGLGALSSRGTLEPAGFAYLGALVLCLMTLTAATDDSTWAPCTSGTLQKCSPAGALYKSFAASENYIAILAAFTLVAAVTALKGRERVVLSLHALVTLVASGSRTGGASVLATMGLVLLLAALLRRNSWRGRAVKGRSLPLAGIALGVAVVGGAAAHLVLTAAPDDFSRRGAIWSAVRQPLDSHPVTGVGLSKWSYYQEFGESPLHFFHSGYAMLLFAGGFTAFGLFCLWIFWILSAASRNEHPIPVTALATLLALYSVTEVVWNPLAVDGLTWIAVGIAAIGSTRMAHESDQVKAGDAGRRRIARPAAVAHDSAT